MSFVLYVLRFVHISWDSTMHLCTQDPREALIVSLKREVAILHQENNHLRQVYNQRYLAKENATGRMKVGQLTMSIYLEELGDRFNVVFAGLLLNFEQSTNF
jgi:hypothetical protein